MLERRQSQHHLWLNLNCFQINKPTSEGVQLRTLSTAGVELQAETFLADVLR